MRTTYMAKAGEVSRKWYVIDAQGKPLGRVATQVAMILRGKHKATYTPNVDCGDYVIVINAKDVVLTGNKLVQKKYYHHSGYPGGLKEVSYGDLMAKTCLCYGTCSKRYASTQSSRSSNVPQVICVC